MDMTLTLPPEAESSLLRMARQRGLPPDAALSAVLAEAAEAAQNTVVGRRWSDIRGAAPVSRTGQDA